MNRPQRQARQNPINRHNPNAPLRQQAQAPEPAPEAPAARARRPREPRRTLDLTLTRVEINMYDTSDPDDEFYSKYFDKPNDDITRRLDALDYSSKKFNTIALQSGITNFELKNIYNIQLNPVSFEKFKAGDYENGKTKSDSQHYEQKVRGFSSKYAAFKDYKHVDDLTWVVKKHRLLFCNILERYIPNNQSNAAIISDLSPMMRIMYLALGSKQHALYLKYAYILKDLVSSSKSLEAENDFNEVELARGGYIPWEIVLEKQKELEQKFNQIKNKKTKEGYALNQDLLLLSLYSLIPPLRNEPKTLMFTEEAHVEGDWIEMKPDGSVVLDLNSEKKKHGAIVLDLPKELENIIKQSYQLYPRLHAFTDTRYFGSADKEKAEKAAGLTTMGQRLERLFLGYKNQDGVQYKVGASMLRSSYVNYRYDIKRINRHLKWNEKEEMAKRMRTSIKMMELQYLKIIQEPMAAIVLPEWQNEVVNGIAEPAKGVDDNGQRARPAANSQPVMIVKKRCSPQNKRDRLQRGAYQRQLEASHKYYDKKKDDILKQQKEYRSTPERRKADARRKVVNNLNRDPEYARAVRQTTLDKYEIQKLNGVYI